VSPLLRPPFGARDDSDMRAAHDLALALCPYARPVEQLRASPPLTLRLQKPNIRDDMLFVIGRKRRPFGALSAISGSRDGYSITPGLKCEESTRWSGRNLDPRCPVELRISFESVR
jgi:hypothetical protein